MSARDIQTAVRRLVGGDQGYKSLDPVPSVGAQPGGVSVGHPGSAGGGSEPVALAEDDYLQREYWTTVTRTTSDGLFSWEEKPIKSILLETGERIRFAEPMEPAP